MSLHARVEYLDDNTPLLFGDYLADPEDPTSGEPGTNPRKILSTTGTVQYDLWKNVISRLELRWDHSLSGRNAFGGTVAGQPDQKNAWMLAANVIYKF